MRNKRHFVVGAALIGLLVGCSDSDKGTEASTEAQAVEISYPEATYREQIEVRMVDLAIDVSQSDTEMKGSFDWVRDLIFDVQRAEGGDQKQVVVQRMDDEKRIEFPGIPRETVREERPLISKILTGERKQGAWSFVIEGVSAEVEQKAALIELAGLEGWMEAFYPSGPFAVGDQWQVDPKGVQRWLGPTVSTASGNIGMTIASTEPYDGHDCIKVKAQIDVQGMIVNQEHGELEFTLHAIAEFVRATELGLDLSVKGVGDIVLQATDPSEKSRMVIEGPFEVIETRTLN